MRKSFLFQTFVQIFLAVTATSAFAASVSSAPLSERLDSLIKRYKVKKESLALVVMKWGDGKYSPLYSHRAGQKMVPASLTKVFTAGAVIDRLSSGHRFVTRLMADAPAVDGVLQGDLYLKGGGDPSFVSENMWFLVNEFTRNGIKKIAGDIVVDDTLFDRDFYPGRSDRRVDRAYDAPIGAMSFNWNSVNIYLRPGEAKSSPARVIVDPLNEFVRLENSAKTAVKNAYQVHRTEKDDHDVISVSGSIALGTSERTVYKSITRPSLWSGYNLMTFLRQRGIEVAGRVKRGKASERARILAESESKPLAQILADLMKFSNNYVAEMLTKNLAVSRGETGSNEGGLKVIRDYVHSLGFSDKDFQLVNASGLTRENRFTVEEIATALNRIRGRFDIAPEFTTALPIAGVDGTLKSRMNDTAAEHWVRAKTGLLNGVVGLAGFSGRAAGDVLTFAFLYNGKTGKEPTIRKLFDDLAVELVR